MKKTKKNLQKRSEATALGRGPAGKSRATVANDGGSTAGGRDKSIGLKNAGDEELLPRPAYTIAISLSSWLSSLPPMLHWYFLFFVTPTLIFLSVCTPPFQSPDEDAHFERAYQISRGGLYGGSGGNVDRGIDEVLSAYSHLPFKSNARVTTADEAAAARVQWTGDTVYRNFPNTASYPPVSYIPQALGVAFGRITGMSVVNTLILSRLLNGTFAVFISAFALYWCRRGKLLMFAVLLMPITISLFGSCSQDASLISFTALAFALVSRQIAEGAPLAWQMTILLSAILLVMSLERPPYAILLLVLFIPGLLPRWGTKPAWLTGVSLAGPLAVLTLAWWMTASASASAAADTGVSAKMQALYILQHPQIIPMILRWIDFPTFAEGIIGSLGWMDTPMPHPYYLAMELMFLIAIAGELVYRSRFRISATVLTLVAALSAVVGVIFIEYLMFTPVGSQVVIGVQGRYFIPPAIAGCIGLPRLVGSDRGYRVSTVFVILLQLLTFFYLPKVIIDRYYLMTDQTNYIPERLYFADALQAQGKLDEAAQQYHQLLAVKPDLYNAHNGLGNILDKKGKMQDAIKEFRLSLAIKPDQAIAHFNIGGILAELHKFPESAEEYSQALRLDPANANTHNDLGVVLYQMGDYEKAAEQFSDALRIDPTHANARKNLDIAQSRMKSERK